MYIYTHMYVYIRCLEFVIKWSLGRKSFFYLYGKQSLILGFKREERPLYMIRLCFALGLVKGSQNFLNK